MSNLDYSNQISSRIATVAMVAITALVILQPDWVLVKSVVKYAEWIAIGFTGFGLLMVALNRRRLMYSAMCSAAAISLYFDQPESPVLPVASTSQSGYDIKIGHCNLSNHGAHPDAMLEYMRAQDTDILTLLEYNQGWDSLLALHFNRSYPYRILRSDLGYKGMAIYSRLPMHTLDSMEVDNARMFGVQLSLDNQLGDLACYLNMIPITPGIHSEAERADFLGKIKGCITKHTIPSIVLGEFSDPNWNNVLRDFRTDCNLFNSRVGMMVTSPCAQFPNFRVPSEHIFYSTTLECTEFLPIGNPYADYIGLTGTYRIKQTSHVVE
jgi:endonuclease/exonuclease/phosphatase (EEP) superfamily protein YafD